MANSRSSPKFRRCRACRTLRVPCQANMHSACDPPQPPELTTFSPSQQNQVKATCSLLPPTEKQCTIATINLSLLSYSLHRNLPRSDANKCLCSRCIRPYQTTPAHVKNERSSCSIPGQLHLLQWYTRE